MNNWRQELLIINFLKPLEEAASHYFAQLFADKELKIKMTHKLVIAIDENDKLQLSIVLARNGQNLVTTMASFSDRQITSIMTQQKGSLQQALMVPLQSICETMTSGLIQILYKYYLKNSLKQDLDATVDGKI